MKNALIFFYLFLIFDASNAFAQTATTSAPQGTLDVIEKAQVVGVSNQGTSTVAGTNTVSQIQTLKAYVMSGVDAGRTIIFDNDYVQLKTGDEFYLHHTTDGNQDEYSVSDPYRLNVLLVLALIFLALTIIFGGIQGVRGFVSLCGSMIIIFYLLIPGILAGYSPAFLSIGIASLIIIVGSYITHGFNRTTSAAVVGMIITVIITGLAAYYFIHAANLTGYNSEEASFLNFNSSGTIDLVGLLFGAIMIGLLGVLYDISIGQAVAVEELLNAANTHSNEMNSNVNKKQIYKRAIRIGREHIGALVNTLAIAYVGAALPILLLAQSSTYGLAYTINKEIFATEIVRILIGSIGLILCVPITTLIATYFLKPGEKTSGGHSHH